MYLIICQIFAVIGITSLLVTFVGYWFSTDYFIKFSDNENFFCSYIMINFTAFLLSVFIMIMGIATDKPELSQKLFFYIYGSTSLSFCSVCFLLFINVYFQRSRKYFAQKRNRSI